MKLLSSEGTFLFKRILPIINIGIIIFITHGIVTAKNFQVSIYLIMPIIVIVVLLLMIKYQFMDLVDEVWDDGVKLLVKNNGKEELLYYHNISHINYDRILLPPKVTLILKEPCRFGNKISYSAHLGIVYAKDPLVVELAEKIGNAKPPGISVVSCPNCGSLFNPKGSGKCWSCGYIDSKKAL